MRLKGIVLGGGSGSRLFPLTKVTHQHMLPLGRGEMTFGRCKGWWCEAGPFPCLAHAGDLATKEPAPSPDHTFAWAGPGRYVALRNSGR